jgi:hypothetical protein
MSSVTLAATIAAASTPITTTTTAAVPPPPPPERGARPHAAALMLTVSTGLEVPCRETLQRPCLLLGTSRIDEAKPRDLPVNLSSEVHRSDHTGLGEVLLQVVFHRLVREITDEEPGFIHNSLPLKKPSGEILQPAGSLNVKLLH